MERDRGSAAAFDELGTLGIEEEFFVVDDRGRPTAGTDELVYEHEPPAILDGRLDHELFKCVIETQTPTLSSLSAAPSKLLAVRNALVEHAADHGFRIASAGLHPLARWRELEHAEKPRYRAQLDRIQYTQHRNTTAGLHIHVGVDDAEKATWIANELRWHLPLLLAVSANSPYWNGFDTGLQSARAKIFEGLPNTGMPTTFESFEEYLQLERRMVETESIGDRGELWYDVRPHTGLGTVEVRTPDAQAEPWRVLAMVEYVYELVMGLAERYEDGATSNTLRRELLDENKWRAVRHGRSASLIGRDGESTTPIPELVSQECDRLGIDGLQRLLDARSGAERQRATREQGIGQLCELLCLEQRSEPDEAFISA